MNPKNMSWYGKHEDEPDPTLSVTAGMLLKQSGAGNNLLIECIEIIVGKPHPVILITTVDTVSNRKNLITSVELNRKYTNGEIELIHAR